MVLEDQWLRVPAGAAVLGVVLAAAGCGGGGGGTSQQAAGSSVAAVAPTPAASASTGGNTPSATQEEAAAQPPAGTPNTAVESAPAPAADPVSVVAVSDVVPDGSTAVTAESTGTSQVAAAAATTSPAATRVTTAANDMTLTHEVVPQGVASTVGWKYRPSIAMNTNPYGWAIPSYWTGIRYADWRALVPWFVIYEGEPGNPASNTTVEISGIEAWAYLQSTRRWQQMGSSRRPTWDSIYAQNVIDLVSIKTNSTGSVDGVRYAVSPGTVVHGGLNQLVTPWSGSSGDIRAVYVAVRHRLAIKDTARTDDRAKANYGLQVGMDYYPWMGSKLSDLGASYVPGAGGGRFLKVGTNWRYSTLLLRASGVTVAELTSSSLPSFAY